MRLTSFLGLSRGNSCGFSQSVEESKLLELGNVLHCFKQKTAPLLIFEIHFPYYEPASRRCYEHAPASSGIQISDSCKELSKMELAGFPNHIRNLNDALPLPKFIVKTFLRTFKSAGKIPCFLAADRVPPNAEKPCVKNYHSQIEAASFSLW
jgi:hypothetical protein